MSKLYTARLYLHCFCSTITVSGSDDPSDPVAELSSSSCRVRVVEFKLSSSSCWVRVVEFELTSSSCQVRVVEFELSSYRVDEFELSSSSCRVVEFDLTSSSCRVRVDEFELLSSSCQVRIVNFEVSSYQVDEFELSSSSWRFRSSCRVVEFELSSPSCWVQVVEFELLSSSCRVRVVEFKLSSSSCWVRVVEFELSSSSSIWRVWVVGFELTSSSSICMSSPCQEKTALTLISFSHAEVPKCAGWEKNEKQKLVPRKVDLSSTMDPARYMSPTALCVIRLGDWVAEEEWDSITSRWLAKVSPRSFPDEERRKSSLKRQLSVRPYSNLRAIY